MSASSDDELSDPYNPRMTRRGAMIAAGATAATLATGSAAAQDPADLWDEENGELIDFTSEIVHNTFLDAKFTIAKIDLEEGMGLLNYFDDADRVASLAEHGYELQPDETDEDEPYRPITTRADRIESRRFTDWPRSPDEETLNLEDYETADDVSFVDENLWDITDLTFAELSRSIELSGAGSAKFDAFETIDDRPRSRYMRLIANVEGLEGSISIKLLDSEGEIELSLDIDPTAEEDALETIATAEDYGIVYQEQIGDMVDADEIAAIEIELEHADDWIEIFGLDLDASSAMDFGTEEYLTTDEDGDTVVKTRTIETPTGEFHPLDLSGIEDLDHEAVLRNLKVDVRQTASSLESAPAFDGLQVQARATEAAGREYAEDLEKVVYHYIPDAFDLSADPDAVYGKRTLPSSRYVEVAIASDTDHEDWDDVDDQTWSSRTSDIEDAELDDEVTLLDNPGTGEDVAVKFHLNLRSSELSDYIESAPGFAIFGTSDDDGLLGSIWVWVLGITGGIAGYIALARRRAAQQVR